MNELIAIELDDCKEKMEKAVAHTESELTKIRAGKANPSMLDSVFVDYYGSSTPLSQVSNINTTDARTIVIQPWERTLLGTIDRKSTRLNSSHVKISYAVFCLKKKKATITRQYK